MFISASGFRHSPDFTHIAALCSPALLLSVQLRTLLKRWINNWCLWPENVSLKHGPWRGLIIHAGNKTMHCRWYCGVEQMGKWNFTLSFNEIESMGAQTGTVGENWAHSLHLIDLKRFPWTNTSEENTTVGPLQPHANRNKVNMLWLWLEEHEQFHPSHTHTHTTCEQSTLWCAQL